MATFELMEMTITELMDGMENGRFTAHQLTQHYLSRIAYWDAKTINAVIELNPDALSIAAELDAERAEGNLRGALHGIPIMLKANIDTADKMTTTAGSAYLEGSTPTQDSYIAKKLRGAGAILLGKTNLSEWANFRSSRSSSGWSALGGQTRNPYALDRSPSGSSSGSGAAVSANFCAGAIGTETDGSVVSPANVNGIVGLKPTLGVIGRSGIIPIAHSQDTAGPMTRTVSDCAIMLGAMTGIDPHDPITQTSVGKVYNDYAQFLDLNGLQGARLGVDRAFLGQNPRVGELLNQAIATMEKLGATVIDVSLNIPDEAGEHELTVLLYEFKADLNAYFDSLNSSKSMRDLHAFNQANEALEMPFFGQEWITAALEKGTLTDTEYTTALTKSKHLTQNAIDNTLSANNLDAIISATGGPAWLIDHVNGDSYADGGSCSSPAAASGYPHITVPMGNIFGLPVGLSFFANAFSEPTLLKLAYAYEQATHARKTPTFQAHSNIQSQLPSPNSVILS